MDSVEIRCPAWDKRLKEFKISKRDRKIRILRLFLEKAGLLKAMENACLAKQKDILSLFQEYIREGIKHEPGAKQTAKTNFSNAQN